jgi:hypothetical protein
MDLLVLLEQNYFSKGSRKVEVERMAEILRRPSFFSGEPE